MKRARWLVLILLPLTFAAGSAEDGCELHLHGNRYYGAFRTCLKSQRFTLADLDKAIASDRPLNPVEDKFAGTRLGSAKRLFSAFAKDAQLAAEWPQVKLKLIELRKELGATQDVLDEAKASTRHFLGFKQLMQLKTKPQGMGWVNSPDGRTLLAAIEDGHTLTVRRADGSVLCRESLPELSKWTLHWRSDGERLFVAVSGSEQKTFSEQWQDFAFRFHFGAKDYLEQIALSDLPARESVAAPLQPQNFAALNSDSRQILYTTSSGATYRIRAGALAVVVEKVGDNSEHFNMNLPSGWVELLIAGETDDGKLLVAALVRDEFRNLQLRVYMPQLKPRRHIYQDAFPWPWGQAAELFFFADPTGRPLLGYQTQDQIRVFDLLSSSRLGELRRAQRLEGWHSSGSQTYFWTSSEDTITVFSVFAHTPP